MSLTDLSNLRYCPAKMSGKLRKVRNELSHEYSNEDEENVTLLNMLFDEIKTINNIFLSLKNYFDLHIRKRIDDKSVQ